MSPFPDRSVWFLLADGALADAWPEAWSAVSTLLTEGGWAESGAGRGSLVRGWGALDGSGQGALYFWAFVSVVD